MSKRAEEVALKAYPGPDDVEFYYETEPGVFSPVTTYGLEKRCFIQGYEQAEKDLALTWEDMREITRIDIEMMDDPEEHPEWMEEQSFYEEVLRRFMQIKEARK